MVKTAQSVHEPCGLTFTDLEALSDELLMIHLAGGHGDALAVLFDRYHRLVFKVALKILRDVSEAEDVMQNIFLEIFRVAAQFDCSRGTTKVWILQYAYHRSMNRRQQLAIRRFYASSDLADVQEHLLDHHFSALTCQETKQLVKEALERLNSVQRRVLQLAYFEGFSLKEIAQETGESLGNVRHHYYRGLTKLRLFLTETPVKGMNVIRTETADAGA